LYWTIIGAPSPTFLVGGAPVTGTELGQTGTTCSKGNNFMYRADATAAVVGKTTVSVGLPDGIDSDGQGASLVITYVDAADPRHNFISIADGSFALAPNTTSTQVVATGFTIGAGFDKATAIDLMANGQPFADTISLQGVSFGTGPTFSGPNGAMWDNRIVDFSSAIHGSETSISTRVTSSDTCLAWLMSAIVIEGIDDPQ